jgi:hypothetical protein
MTVEYFSYFATGSKSPSRESQAWCYGTTPLTTILVTPKVCAFAGGVLPICHIVTQRSWPSFSEQTLSSTFAIF